MKTRKPILISYLKCPQCQTILELVTQSESSPLNPDQFNSVKAGDYYCPNCKDPNTKSGHKYYWERDLFPSQISNPKSQITAPTRPTITQRKNGRYHLGNLDQQTLMFIVHLVRYHCDIFNINICPSAIPPSELSQIKIFRQAALRLSIAIEKSEYTNLPY